MHCSRPASWTPSRPRRPRTDIDRLIEPLCEAPPMQAKVKANVVKQEHEKQEELKRSSLRAVAALLTIPDSMHQAFVRLVRSGPQQEVFFVTEQDKQGGGYTFEMDVRKAGKESFNLESGDYMMSLLIGDFAVEQPLEWDIGTIKLTFADQPSLQKDHLDAYKPKPEIKHLFREPEKRPPAVVLTMFTGLVLAPLALLLVVWLGMGANLSNVTSNGPWALVFQLGLVAIFGLYYCFWAQLNMFQTLKFLALLGVPTFTAGNRFLRRIAQARNAGLEGPQQQEQCYGVVFGRRLSEHFSLQLMFC